MANVVALVLPFQFKLGKVEYLIHRELIPLWDQSSDLCGITVLADEETLDQSIASVFLDKYGIGFSKNELKSLGVCATGRNSDEFVYLYGIDLSGKKDLDHLLTEPTHQGVETSSEKVFWCPEDILLESVDAQLIACFAKIKHLLL